MIAAALAGLRRRFRRRAPAPRRRARLTRGGKAFVFVTVGVGIAAVNTGNNLLYLMLGLMLSLLLLSMVLSEIALMRVLVTRRLPTRAFARTPTLFELHVDNVKRRLPSYSLEVEDRAEDEPTDRRCYFLKIPAAGMTQAAYERIPQKRGILTLSGFRVGTRYPFGLVEKAFLHERPEELLVYPQLVDIDQGLLRGIDDGADHPVGRVGPGTEIAGLREYHPGDEARAIHWRRSAALGRIVVRERERDAAARMTLVLDNARPAAADESWDLGFEHAVSEAASLAAAALTRGAAVDVAVRGARSEVVFPGGTPDAIWAFLARLTTADPSDPVPVGASRSIPVPIVPRGAQDTAQDAGDAEGGP
ncbi:MAG: DUF58 domain-containing protein [Deltaproteobacteria bacterium]|nr:DUF58 domain-containing protein [Deltaproteobacteria bacterium]